MVIVVSLLTVRHVQNDTIANISNTKIISEHKQRISTFVKVEVRCPYYGFHVTKRPFNGDFGD